MSADNLAELRAACASAQQAYEQLKAKQDDLRKDVVYVARRFRAGYRDGWLEHGKALNQRRREVREELFRRLDDFDRLEVEANAAWEVWNEAADKLLWAKSPEIAAGVERRLRDACSAQGEDSNGGIHGREAQEGGEQHGRL